MFSKYFTTYNMQFAFKAKTGCNHSKYAVRKTIEFFIEWDLTVNLCALDLKKAFDKMNIYALFIKLMQRDCHVVLINLLNCWYSKIFCLCEMGRMFLFLCRT